MLAVVLSCKRGGTLARSDSGLVRLNMLKPNLCHLGPTYQHLRTPRKTYITVLRYADVGRKAGAAAVRCAGWLTPSNVSYANQ